MEKKECANNSQDEEPTEKQWYGRSVGRWVRYGRGRMATERNVGGADKSVRHFFGVVNNEKFY